MISSATEQHGSLESAWILDQSPSTTILYDSSDAANSFLGPDLRVNSIAADDNRCLLFDYGYVGFPPPSLRPRAPPL